MPDGYCVASHLTTRCQLSVGLRGDRKFLRRNRGLRHAHSGQFRFRIWHRISPSVTEFNRLNSKPIFSPGGVR